ILHRDCSLNNIMIEDCEGSSQGALIDWEFASRITSDNTYPTGGTEASLSVPAKIEGVKHFYHDDLEALFYVFVWVCIALKGPADTRRELNPLKSRPKGLMV
ncbi:hypothetical protein BDR03DRAFT_814083, partial [Suillus americanus]